MSYWQNYWCKPSLAAKRSYKSYLLYYTIKSLHPNTHTDLQQTFQDEWCFFFLQMARCVLISPLCTEHQNVWPKEWLVSDNQNQITSFFLSWGMGRRRWVYTDLPFLKHGIPLFYKLSTEMTNNKCVVIEPETQWQSIDRCSWTMTTEFYKYMKAGGIVIRAACGHSQTPSIWSNIT